MLDRIWPLVLALLCCLAALAAGLLTTLPASPPQGQPTPPEPADEDLARAYVEAQCWHCHSVSQRQDELSRLGVLAAGARPAGPDLSGVGGLYPDGWHFAHLWQPDAVSWHSHMPAQRHLFALGGKAGSANLRGEMVPVPSATTRKAVQYVQTLMAPSPQRLPWPRGRHSLTDSGSVVEGKKLFAELCSGCHGADGGGRSAVSAFFEKPPANLSGGIMMWRSTKAPLPSYDDLYTTLTNGLPGAGMPSFAHLSESRRASLVAYLASMHREEFNAYEPQFAEVLGTDAPAFTPEMVERGRALFRDQEYYKCSDCHGADGRGDGYLRGEVLRSFGYGPRNLVAERLRRGYPEGLYVTLALGLGRAMSGYLKDDASNEADLWALVAYVRSINRFER